MHVSRYLLFQKKIKKSNKTLEKKPETNDNKKINFINIF